MRAPGCAFVLRRTCFTWLIINVMVNLYWTLRRGPACNERFLSTEAKYKTIRIAKTIDKCRDTVQLAKKHPPHIHRPGNNTMEEPSTCVALPVGRCGNCIKPSACSGRHCHGIAPGTVRVQKSNQIINHLS